MFSGYFKRQYLLCFGLFPFRLIFLNCSWTPTGSNPDIRAHDWCNRKTYTSTVQRSQVRISEPKIATLTLLPVWEGWHTLSLLSITVTLCISTYASKGVDSKRGQNILFLLGRKIKLGRKSRSGWTLFGKTQEIKCYQSSSAYTCRHPWLACVSIPPSLKTMNSPHIFKNIKILIIMMTWTPGWSHTSTMKIKSWKIKVFRKL